MIKTNDTSLPVRAGDWVRFMAGSRLVLGIVQYVRRSGYGRDLYAFTDIGSVEVSSILEVRSGEPEKVGAVDPHVGSTPV